MGEQIPEKLCGRPLSAADMETIRRETRLADPPIQAEIPGGCAGIGVDQHPGAAEADELPGGVQRLHRSGLIEPLRAGFRRVLGLGQ